MPVTDSIIQLTDSIKADSILNAADSAGVLLTDTLSKSQTHVNLFTGYDGLLRSSTPQSEPWVFIFVLTLFLMFVFSVLRSSVWLRESVTDFFKVKERTSIFSKSTATDYVSRIILLLFSTGVLSFYLFNTFQQNPEKYQLLVFAKFSGITAGFILLKFLLIEIFGYIFLNRQLLKVARDSYYKIYIYLGILLFPIIVFKIYASDFFSYYTGILSLIFIGFAYILLIIKLFQIFFEKIDDSFYLLLYLCTLEILPLFYMVRVYKFII